MIQSMHLIFPASVKSVMGGAIHIDRSLNTLVVGLAYTDSNYQDSYFSIKGRTCHYEIEFYSM